MGSQRLVALVGAITIAIAGCGSDNTSTPTASAPSPNPAATPAAATAPIPPVAPAPAAQPLVVQKKQSTRAVAGLIQPTNAEERANQVESQIRNSENRNPFVGLPPALPEPTIRKTSPLAMSPLVPPISLEKRPTLPKTQATPLGFNVPPVFPPAPAVPVRPSAVRPSAARPSTNTAFPPGSPPPPAAPVPPSTNTASAVEVTGVVFVGNSPQAIVIAPGDPGSRYVGVGQRISGGKVLIKRIEMGSGSIPVVILEENGVEVAKSVGERSAAPAKQASQPINQLAV